MSLNKPNFLAYRADSQIPTAAWTAATEDGVGVNVIFQRLSFTQVNQVQALVAKRVRRYVLPELRLQNWGEGSDHDAVILLSPDKFGNTPVMTEDYVRQCTMMEVAQAPNSPQKFEFLELVYCGVNDPKAFVAGLEALGSVNQPDDEDDGAGKGSDSTS